jgi:DNA polymerase-1
MRGELVGIAVAPDGTVAISPGGDSAARLITITEAGALDEASRPRWATWSQETARRLADDGTRLATCWDIAAVHRMLHGGFRADPGYVWASLRGLPLDTVPADEPPDLFNLAEESDDPLGPDGHLRPEWTHGGWASTPQTLLTWAALAREVAEEQREGPEASPRRFGGPRGFGGPEGSPRGDGGREAPHGSGRQPREGGSKGGQSPPWETLLSESTAELLCAELAAGGLPVDRDAAEELLAGIVGPRPRDDREAAAIRAERDAAVLRHAPGGITADLRSPLQVKTLLAAAGIDVPDTRAWRLEEFRDSSPLVKALLEWRKAERIATTYGYSWLDAHLSGDGRLRGSWTGSDGAAGRMTASAGLHNMPAVLRKAVIAADGHVFVRADLGQIEPRVLAAVSGDRALAAATRADDMYLPVGKELGVDRPVAKVAMIAAMYGQTTGHGGAAARRMRQAYPVAMGYLDAGDRDAREGRDLRTYGGRRVRMNSGGSPAQVAGRGRYGRNALIQGAAAELFKMWAVTVRSRGLGLGAEIVMCLHDELLVHVPAGHAEAAAGLVADCLDETARRWTPDGDVRFIADISVVRCWADAKG